GMEAQRRRVVRLLAPQRVRAGQRGVAAEIDLDCRSEPAQRPAVVPAEEECRLGEVHLRADVLHPFRVALAVEKTDRGRIAAKRLVGESVDGEKSQNPCTFGAFPYSNRTNTKPTMMITAR